MGREKGPLPASLANEAYRRGMWERLGRIREAAWKTGKSSCLGGKSYGEVPVGPPTSRVAVGESQSLRVTWPLSTKGGG